MNFLFFIFYLNTEYKFHIIELFITLHLTSFVLYKKSCNIIFSFRSFLCEFWSSVLNREKKPFIRSCIQIIDFRSQFKNMFIFISKYIYLQLYERKNKIQISEIHYWQYFMIMFIFHKFEYQQKNIFIAILCI